MIYQLKGMVMETIQEKVIKNIKSKKLMIHAQFNMRISNQIKEKNVRSYQDY